jgi:hypothetical protein
MKRRLYFFLPLCLALVLEAQQANAQITFSEFKVDNATAINVYSGMNTSRQATFSVKLTRPTSSGANYLPAIKLVGGSFPEADARGVSMTQSSWNFGSSSSEMVSTVTGRFNVDYGDVNNRIHTGIQAVSSNTFSPGRSGTVTITEVTPPEYGQKPPVTITSFTVDGAKSLAISPTAKTVTYSLGLSKDPGYTDEFVVSIRGNSGAATLFSPPITSAGAITASSVWPLTGTKRVGTITKSFQISTQDITNGDNNLAAVATSLNGVTLTLTPRFSSTQTTAIALTQTAPACISDVYVQNTSSLNGTTSAGKNLYAGRAVTNTTNGDVIIRSGQNVGFTARESISLSDGFAVGAGATFAAYIDGGVCSSARLAAEGMSQETIAYTAANEKTSSRSFTGQEQQIATAYPNPTAATLILPEGVENVTLLDQQGRPTQVRSKSGKMNVQNLPDGMYNLQMQQNGKMVNQPIEIKH